MVNARHRRRAIQIELGSGVLSMHQRLYRSDGLSVVYVGGFHSGAIVITFDCYTFDHTLNRPGFGEGFFQGRRMDAIHIVSRDNRWYQNEDMPEVLAAAREVAQRYGRVVTYGSSMGGYAAIRFARALGAETAIAIAPQYSIDPRVAPFDDRWAESRRITFRPEDSGPIDDGPEMVVFYDPFETIDRQHVALIERDVTLTHVRVPYAGHSAGLYLSEVAMMAESVIDIVEGRFDAAEKERVLRRRRREVGQYYDNLSRIAARRRPALALALARLAVECRGDNALFLTSLADRLAQNGLFEEAETVQRRALDLHPNALPFVKRLVSLLLRRNAVEEARTTATRLVELGPGEPESHHLLAETHARSGDLAAAATAEGEAVRLEPAHQLYRDALDVYAHRAHTAAN